MQAASGVQNDNVIAVVFRMGHGLCGNGLGLFPLQLEHRRARLGAHDAKLVDCGGAVDVAGHQQGAVPLFQKALGQLGAVCGFARALQAAHHNDGGRLRLDVDACRALAAAHQGNQLFIYNFYHLLGGGKALHHLMAQAALCYRFDEPFGDGVVHIRLQKGHAHLTHGVFYILFGKLALAAQLFEHAAQLGSQRFKRHTMRPLPQGPKARFSFCRTLLKHPPGNR